MGALSPGSSCGFTGDEVACCFPPAITFGSISMYHTAHGESYYAFVLQPILQHAGYESLSDDYLIQRKWYLKESSKKLV